MATAEKIVIELKELQSDDQTEVLNFVKFLKYRRTRREEDGFKEFSLGSAMRGMEDEPDLYNVDDIKERMR
jgi:hypothetical protein